MIITHVPAYSRTIRVVGAYQWDATNDFTADVTDAVTLADLLTNPPVDFVVSADDPLRSVVGLTNDQIATLVVDHAVTSAADVAALDDATIATALGVDESAATTIRTLAEGA